MKKKDIRNLTIEEIENAMAGWDQPAYRARQIFFWLYRKNAAKFDGMRNLPAGLRTQLKEKYYISSLVTYRCLKSADGTRKFLLKLEDGNFIESVLIRSGGRTTACLSTQVGCKFGCVFCASGMKKFIRNLTAAEIVNQLPLMRAKTSSVIRNIVFMGIGEPLDNFKNLSRAIKIINNPAGIGIGARKMTVSTCGIIPGIKLLEGLGLQIELSLSLHAADNTLRNRLVPVNKKYPLEKLVPVLKEYSKSTGRKITLEYVLIKGENDSLRDADVLARLAGRLRARVNLIACNPVSGMVFPQPETNDMKAFKKRLLRKGVVTVVRKPKGKDISAACGQLAGKLNSTE